jgi:FtsH-binding integral membrane protein
MSYADNPYRAPLGDFAAMAAVDERTSFITRTYLHLAGAVTLFVALEAVLLQTAVPETMLNMLGRSQYSWLIVLGLFMVVSMIAGNWARSAVNPATQYMGLGLYVVAEAVIFLPLLYIAQQMDAMRGTNIIHSAAVATLGLFGLMTAAVFITRKDFSFLRTFLIFGSLAAMGFIVVAILFHIAIGPILIYAMIALACGYILYDTSNVLHHYRIGQHVAASLALFASLALLFWYILQLFMSRRD